MTISKSLDKMPGWRIQKSDKVVIVKHEGTTMELPIEYASILLQEWRIWEECYTPAGGLKGKSVLDVGAGSGETAYFFLREGASKIYAVEKDPTAIEYLRKNSYANRWNVEILAEPFSLDTISKLNGQFDVMKVDVEGAESCLLGLNGLPCPSVIEVHSEKLRLQFARKFDLAVVHKIPGSETYIMR